jgi:hypothetical protein
MFDWPIYRGGKNTEFPPFVPRIFTILNMSHKQCILFEFIIKLTRDIGMNVCFFSTVEQEGIQNLLRVIDNTFFWGGGDHDVG